MSLPSLEVAVLAHRRAVWPRQKRLPSPEPAKPLTVDGPAEILCRKISTS